MLFHFRVCVCFIPLGISVFCCWFLKTHLQVKMLTICHAMQMKYHVLLPSICYDVLYFGSVLKYNHVLFFKKQTQPSKLHYLCHMVHTCIYIWFLPRQREGSTKLSVFISLLDMHTSSHSLHIRLMVERKLCTVHLSLSFHYFPCK